MAATVKDFRVEAIAQAEFEEAAGWYEPQREGLSFELIAENDRLRRSPRLKVVSSS